ncbi:unnamed protein product [Eruca vesicaria subsp. sativa]|uniref:Transmembrane protein n=1 Tax=Eruca vesicaria subsp. sativa TaxID=29727 RepID=A0ABC8LWA4_ERUVS|nr:unnamed protein product [Eruca vesicaria subsp. sativa]
MTRGGNGVKESKGVLVVTRATVVAVVVVVVVTNATVVVVVVVMEKMGSQFKISVFSPLSSKKPLSLSPSLHLSQSAIAELGFGFQI